VALNLSSLSSGTVPNWLPLQNSTPGAVSTITFSGLSGYSKYRILAPNLVFSATSTALQVRLNGDTAANYLVGGTSSSANTPGTVAFSSGGSTSLAFQTANTTPGSYQVDIDHALLAVPKFITANCNVFNNSNAFTTQTISGTYTTTSTLTSITLLLSANNFSTGTIYILGAN